MLPAVVKDRAQSVVFTARDICVSVERDSRDLLAGSAEHLTSLAVTYLKTFVMHNRGDENSKTRGTASEFRTSGKDQIVRIARVVRIHFPSQPTESAIEPKRGKVGQCG